MAEKISQIRVSGTDYDLAKTYKTANVTSLENLDVTNDLIYAKLSGPTTFSLNGEMEVGQKLILIIEPTAEFVQGFSLEGGINSFDNLKFKANEICKIIVTCYESGKYSLNNIGATGVSYYILVSTNSATAATLLKYTDSTGTSTENISIPANSNNYKVDGLIYGFQTDEFSAYGIKSLDLSNFDTSNVTSMNGMFFYCSSLTSLDLSNFDTSKVTDMSNMFNSCSKLTSLDLSNFDTSNVTNMSSMFFGCDKLTSLDLSNSDTSNVTVMVSMFNSCDELTSLDLSNFDTSKVTHMQGMFNGCNKLNHIKCKQAFKDWCWTNQSTITLPSAMRSGGGGNWEIVD